MVESGDKELASLESFRGYTLLDEVRESLAHYDPNRIQNLLTSHEIQQKAKQAVPFGNDSETVPQVLKDHCTQMELPFVLQSVIDELYSQVPVVEIEGQRGAGKGTLVEILRKGLPKERCQVDVAVGSGFIDPDNPDEQKYMYGLTLKQTEMIKDLHKSRETSKRKFSPYKSVKEANEDMPSSIFNFWYRYCDTDDELLETLNDVKRYYNAENSGRPGEFSWNVLQEAMLTKMNNLLGRKDGEIEGGQSKTRVMIVDGGRISRLYGFARYASKFHKKDPYGLTFPIPDTWQEYISSTGVSGYDKEVTLPLPRKIIVLKANEETLIERAMRDTRKKNERESRISSIRRNTDPFYETAAIFQERFPDRVIFVDADRSVAEVTEEVWGCIT